MDFFWPGGAEAAITFTFDDGYAATYDAAVFSLHQRSLYGTFFVITNQVGAPFCDLATANWGQWKEAASLGHEIGSHGLFHTSLAGGLNDLHRLLNNLRGVSNRRAYIRQILATFRALNRWQRSVSPIPVPKLHKPGVNDLLTSRQRIDQEIDGPLTESFSYPAGRYDAAARQSVVEAGFLSARSLDLGLNRPSCNLFALRAVTPGPGMAISDLVAWIDRARVAHAWLIMVFHLVAEENIKGYPYFCSSSHWQQLLDEVQARPIWTATQRQVTHYLLEQVVYEPRPKR